jgi:hypothetical protein
VVSKRVLIGIGVLALTVGLYAAASYPTSVKSFSVKLAGQTISAAHINDIQDEIVAIEGALLNGFAHTLKPSVAGAQDLGTAGLPWGTTRTRAVNFDAVSTLTVASGAVVATRSNHALDTEGAAATDDLDTITATGLTDGFVLVLRPANVAHVVTVKDGTGNLLLNGDCALTATDRTLTLIFDGTNWRELARSAANSPTGAVLLYAASGTNTSAVAANVDTFAISALTAKDRLWIVWSLESVTQATAGPIQFYDSTDSVVLTALAAAGAGVASGNGFSGTTILAPTQSDNHKVQALNTNVVYTTGTMANFASAVATMTQLWTGSFTIAFRHAGVTAGGTLYWNWSIYRMAGQ